MTLVSISALVVLAWAAWVLSAGRGTLRAGILVVLALALFCFAGLIGYLNIAGFDVLLTDNTGRLAGLRPIFLSMLGAFAGVGGLLLLVAAKVETGTVAPILPGANEADRFGLTSRWLHWLIALIILAMIPSGVIAAGLAETDELNANLMYAHKSFGLMALLLILVRVFRLLKFGKPGLSSGLATWERFLAKATHVALYLLMLAFPLTGLLLSAFAGRDSYFFFVTIPPFVDEPMRAVVQPLGLLHKLIIPIVAYALIALHVAGSLKHALIDRDRSALRRMTG